MLTVHQLQVTAETTSPLVLDAQSGSALRGAFFRAIWGRFCTNREAPECRVCSLVSVCPVSALVAPLRDEGSRGRDIPRPYIITPPLGGMRRYEPGETFTFGMALVGASAKLFPYVIRSFQEMEHNGLGRPLPELQGRRGRFRVRDVRIHHPFTNQEQELWNRDSTQVLPPQLCVTHEDVKARARLLPADRLLLNFLTPTRLISLGGLTSRPCLPVLVARLLERIDALRHAYGDGQTTPLHERDAMLRAAELTRVVDDCTQWVDIMSYSARQGRSTPIGGFTGHATFVGDLTNLREVLVWGELVGAGKNVVKGDGHYCIEAQ